MLDLSDQALEFQAAQVVAAASLVVRFAEQSTDQRPDGLVAEPADQVATHGESAGQGHDPRVAEPQGWGPPTVHEGRPRDPLKGWTRKDTTLTDPFSIQQPAVHGTGLDDKFVQMDDPAQHPEIGRVVDHRFDPQRPTQLEILLDPGMLVPGVDRDIDTPGDDAGSEDAGRRAGPGDPAAEDQFHLLRPAQVQVVRDERFEERPTVAGPVEHHRAGHLDLPHRQIPPIPVLTIRGRQRQRYPWPPPVGERRNVGRAEPVTDRLQPDRVVGGGESVVQRGESDPGPGRLLLGPLMSVQPDFDRIRQVGTDLDERRAELLVPQVEVETRDATVRPTPLEMRGTSTIRGPGTA